ncbi:hypothetical protein, partial [Streptomyces rubiginosohelvolus]
MAAPGSVRPRSTTFNSGCRSATSAADSIPVSPLPGRRHMQPHALGEPLLCVRHGHLHALAPFHPDRELVGRGHARVT